MDEHLFAVTYRTRRFRIVLTSARAGDRIAWRAAVAELVAGPGGDAVDERGVFRARTPDGALAVAAGAVARRLLGGPVARRDPRPDPRRAVGEAALRPAPSAPLPASQTAAPWEAAPAGGDRGAGPARTAPPVPPPPAPPWGRWGRDAAPSPAPVPAPEPAPDPAAGASGEASAGAAVPAAPIAFRSSAERAAAMAATVDAALDRLAAQLAAGHTAEFEATLAFYARFHRYSFANTVLIRAQRPDATLVAGLRRWNDMGYRVRAGEKAIWILAPLTRKEVDPATGEEVEAVVGFRPAPVFADCQLADLDAKPLPAPFPVLADDVGPLYEAVRARIEATGIAVEERSLPPGVEGASQGGRILIRPGLDSRSRLFVLLHELAHELAHRGEAQRVKPRQQREIEAESTSFAVAAALGLENPGSRDYLLGYRATAEELRASLATIQALVRRVLALVGEPAAGADAVRAA